MKVVHLVPAMEQGGVESVVRDLNRALARAGHESVVVSVGGALASVLEADGGRHVRLDLKSKNPLTAIPRAMALRSLLRRERPDVVCAHSRVPAWLFVLANRALGLRWISFAHGANTVSRYSAVMTRGDVVAAPSKFLADFLLANYARRPAPAPLADRLRVVPPCVDLARFDPARVDPAAVAALRREWGVGEGDFVTMAVGRLTPVKGLDALVRDFAAQASGRRDRRLVLVGREDRRHRGYVSSLRRLAAELGVDGQVVFAGAQEKVPECLSIADEVVSANTVKPESFGLSVAEALAMNRPVRLLRHFGGAAEIVDAVAAAGAPSTREAVRSLYSFEAFSTRALELFREAST